MFCSLEDPEFTDSEDLDDDLGLLECDHQDEDSKERRVAVEHVRTKDRLKNSRPKSNSSLPRKKHCFRHVMPVNGHSLIMP